MTKSDLSNRDNWQTQFGDLANIAKRNLIKVFNEIFGLNKFV